MDDQAQDLADLGRTGRIAVAVERTDSTYTLDASAVLRVDAARLLGVSVDYERYTQMGVPNLRASRVVSTEPDGSLSEAANPNGSARNIAGIFNETKSILGLMPHPERLADPALGGADGARFFKGLVEALR